MLRTRAPWVLGGLAVLGVAPGCNPCDPDPDPISVSAEVDREAFHGLPKEASGAHELLDQLVADSHARVEADYSISGASEVSITSMEMDLEVDTLAGEQDYAAELTGFAVGDEAFGKGGVISRGDTVRHFFRAANLADIQFSEGFDYLATLRLGWEFQEDECPPQSGTTEIEVEGNVRHPDDTDFEFPVEYFSPHAFQAAPPTEAAGAALQVALHAPGTPEVVIESLQATITYFSPEGVGGFAVLDNEDLHTEVDGVSTDVIAQNQQMDVFTDGSSGSVELLDDVDGGKAVVRVDVEYNVPGEDFGTLEATLLAEVDVQ